MKSQLSLLLLGAILLQVCCGSQFIDYVYQGRTNKLFIPSLSFLGARPLFVMLHGCTQNATDFATGTQMNHYGELYNFYVLYPEQPVTANVAKCWNWFLPEDQVRGSGEPQLIVGMAQQVMSQHRIDASKVFAGGLSAGGAMSVVLGATYPDFFSAIAVSAGLEYKAGTDVLSGVYATLGIGLPDANTQGQLAYQAMGSHARPLAVLVIWGTADSVVNPINDPLVVTQWAKTLDLTLGHGTAHGYITDTPTISIPATVPGGRSYTRKFYSDSQTREVLIQAITVNGMDHAWSGGNAAGTYTDPKGPDASLIMADWFLLYSALENFF